MLFHLINDHCVPHYRRRETIRRTTHNFLLKMPPDVFVCVLYDDKKKFFFKTVGENPICTNLVQQCYAIHRETLDIQDFALSSM